MRRADVSGISVFGRVGLRVKGELWECGKGLGCGRLSPRRVWQGPTHSQCKDEIIRFDKIPGTLHWDFMKEILSKREGHTNERCI